MRTNLRLPSEEYELEIGFDIHSYAKANRLNENLLPSTGNFYSVLFGDLNKGNSINKAPYPQFLSLKYCKGSE